MPFLKSILKSFYYAFRGLWYMIRTERNFRIHLVFIVYVSVFAFFYGLDGTQWAILWLTFGVVPTVEIINSAIENTVDIKTREQNQNARFAKDLAAAAVLFSSIAAIAVGICLFSEKEKLLNALQITFSPPWLIILAASAFPMFWFIRGGKNVKKMSQTKRKSK